MKKGVLLTLLVSLLFPGCYTYYVKSPPTATEPNPPPTETHYFNTTQNAGNMVPVAMPNVTNSSNVVYSAAPSKNAAAIEAGLMNTNWISPGKVTIENLYKGAEADYTLRIHNGGDSDTVFDVNPRQADATMYEKLPQDCIDWVTMPQYSVYIPAKSTYDMPIMVKIVKDAGMKGKTYEVWISVIDKGQKGMIQTELCSRWIIATRK